MQTKKTMPVWGQRLTLVVGALLIFSVGVLAGRGDLSLMASQRSAANPNLPENLNYSSVEQVYDSLRQNYSGKLTTAQLLNGLKEGLANATNDPYTEYFTASEAQGFDDQLNNTFSGIGAELGKDEDDNLIIVSPISGYPADQAGLKAKDIITAIDGKDATGMSTKEAVTEIRGKAGTPVTLQILRDHQQRHTFKIVRQDIQIPSVDSKVLADGIGYIQITTFGNDTAELMQQAAEKMRAAKVKGIVLDLRGNPGGALAGAVSVASQWLPEDAPVVQEKRGDVVVDRRNSHGPHTLVGIPTVVLINGGSASASEITAAALRDNDAAYIIGEKSFGKGVVQQLISFGDGSELKVTVASWYPPSGNSINHKGITPDQTVKLTDSDIAKGNDSQKTAAIKYLQQQR